MTNIYHVDHCLPPPNTIVYVMFACGVWQWLGAFHTGEHWYTRYGVRLHSVEYWTT